MPCGQPSSSNPYRGIFSLAGPPTTGYHMTLFTCTCTFAFGDKTPGPHLIAYASPSTSPPNLPHLIQ
nr:hypothetical protein Iba_chr07fCG11550 [Ipomoea batatas]